MTLTPILGRHFMAFYKTIFMKMVAHPIFAPPPLVVFWHLHLYISVYCIFVFVISPLKTVLSLCYTCRLSAK